MSDTIKFTLDGKEVEAEKGQTIWEVAHGRGLVIPHLCHKPAPGYRPDGNCRACMVEVEGERTLVASCIREAADGMVVTTNSNRAESARKMVVEMLLADQPERDVSHDKSSHLWDMAEANGVSESRFPKLEEGRIPLLDDSHVAMSVNLDACIQCGLCVRACREVQVNDVIGMAGRGHDAYPTFDFADPMGASTCVACGECVQACPTGALMPSTVVDDAQVGDSKDYDSEVESVCPFCGVGCQISIKVKDGKVKYVEGINGPANEGRLCVKGRFGFDYIHHNHRLTKPLIRREDAPGKGLNVDPDNWQEFFREASWDEALDFAANGLKGRGREGGRFRIGQMHQRRGVSVPEIHPPGLWPQQCRSLHPAVPCLIRCGADRKCGFRRGDGHVQRDRKRRCGDCHRLQPDREPPGCRDLFQAVHQAWRQADRDGSARGGVCAGSRRICCNSAPARMCRC